MHLPGIKSTTLTPLVSIIIPTYNRAHLIGKALQSVQGQTFKNWECIVVDDFSTDDTAEIITQLSKVDNRFRYLKNERSKGPQGARNTGIIHSQFPWIAFNDSDDEWLPDKLEKQIEMLKRKDFNSFSVVHGNCEVFNHEYGTKETWELNPIAGKDAFKYFLKESSILFPSVLTSKKALESVKFLDENVPSYQEWDLAISLSRNCDFIHIHEPLFIYHKHLETTISKDLERDIFGVNYIRRKYRPDFIEQYDEELFHQSLLQNIHRIVPNNLWSLGKRLLNQNKSYLPEKTYNDWLFCFNLKSDPLKGKKNALKNILQRIKRKIHD